MINARINEIFTLDGIAISIGRIEDNSKLTCLMDQRSTPRVYLLNKYNPTNPLLFNFTNHYQSPNDKNALFIINFKIPNSAVVKLPSHLQCYIIDQDFPSLKIEGTFEIISKGQGENNYLSSKDEKPAPNSPIKISHKRKSDVLVDTKSSDSKNDDKQKIIEIAEAFSTVATLTSTATSRIPETVSADASHPPAKKSKIRVISITDAPAPVVPLEDRKGQNQIERRSIGTERLKAYLQNPNDAKYDFRPLLPHQIKVLTEILAAKEKNILKYVIPAVTGFGKTATFIQKAEITGEKTIIIAPTDELIDQTVAACKIDAPSKKVGELFSRELNTKESHNDGFTRIIKESDIIVTSYNTLQLHYEKVPFSEIDTVISDEGHRSQSDKRSAMISYILEKGCAVEFYSATPGDVEDDDNCYSLLGYKLDGSDNPIQGIKRVTEAITQKINCPVIAGLFIPKTKEDRFKATIDLCINGQSPNGSYFREMQGVVFGDTIAEIKRIKDELNNIDINVFDASKKLRTRYADNMQTESKNKKISFTNKDYEKAYNDFKIAEAVYASDSKSSDNSLSKSERKKIIEKARLGGIGTLLTVNALLEGFDLPSASFAIMMKRNPQKRKTIVQAAGRILRNNKNDPNKVGIFLQFKLEDTKHKPYLFLSELDPTNQTFSCGVPSTYFQNNSSSTPRIIELKDIPEYKTVWKPSDNLTLKIEPKVKASRLMPKLTREKSANKPKIIIPVDIKEAYEKLMARLIRVQEIFDTFKETINIEKIIPEDADEKPVTSISDLVYTSAAASAAPPTASSSSSNSKEDRSVTNFSKEAESILKQISLELAPEAIESEPAASSATPKTAIKKLPALKDPGNKIIRLANRCNKIYNDISHLMTRAILQKSDDETTSELEDAMLELHESIGEAKQIAIRDNLSPVETPKVLSFDNKIEGATSIPIKSDKDEKISKPKKYIHKHINEIQFKEQNGIWSFDFSDEYEWIMQPGSFKYMYSTNNFNHIPFEFHSQKVPYLLSPTSIAESLKSKYLRLNNNGSYSNQGVPNDKYKSTDRIKVFTGVTRIILLDARFDSASNLAQKWNSSIWNPNKSPTNIIDEYADERNDATPSPTNLPATPSEATAHAVAAAMQSTFGINVTTSISLPPPPPLPVVSTPPHYAAAAAAYASSLFPTFPHGFAPTLSKSVAFLEDVILYTKVTKSSKGHWHLKYPNNNFEWKLSPKKFSDNYISELEFYGLPDFWEFPFQVDYIENGIRKSCMINAKNFAPGASNIPIAPDDFIIRNVVDIIILPKIGSYNRIIKPEEFATEWNNAIERERARSYLPTVHSHSTSTATAASSAAFTPPSNASATSSILRLLPPLAQPLNSTYNAAPATQIDLNKDPGNIDSLLNDLFPVPSTSAASSSSTATSTTDEEWKKFMAD